MDVRSNFAPARFVAPDEPNTICGYDFAELQLATFGRYLNRCSTGAVYDLATQGGAPIVGYSGGMRCNDSANDYWRCTAATPIPVTAAASAYAVELSGIEANPAALRYLLVNGSVDGFDCRLSNAGVLSITFDRATLSSSAAGLLNGKGPVRVAGLYDGAQQHLVINGRIYDSDNVVPDAPDGYFAVGQHGTFDKVQVYRAVRTIEQERASYIRDFASRILWQWQPRDVGEGPVGGILTGSYSGVGGYTCPLGAATMGFVQRGDRLTLTDTQAVNLHRIDFEFANRPWFGSFLVEYEVRNPATDSMVVGFTPMRGVDPTAAASGSYWLHVRQVAGPWWRSSVYLANGAQIDAADTPTLPVAGDRGKVLFSRDVDGTIQVWSYLQSTNGWWWSTATGTDVTVLPEACITVAPRGAYVERVTWFQGAASPHELGIQVP